MVQSVKPQLSGEEPTLTELLWASSALHVVMSFGVFEENQPWCNGKMGNEDSIPKCGPLRRCSPKLGNLFVQHFLVMIFVRS